MTPIEKAEAALNHRLERLQANLREASSETARQFLFQSLVVCVGLGEAMTDYVRMIGQYAQGRYGEIKQENDTLTAQHADLLKSGNELLEQLKASPNDRIIRKKIEVAQQAMEGIQKILRRGANALQRDLAPSLGMVDKMAASVRRFGEADQIDALKRAAGMIVENARELYAAQPELPAKDIVDAAAWEKSAGSEIDRAADFHEAYARAGYQALLALDVMTMAVSPTPPQTAEEATRRATESVAARLKAVAVRFATS
ncbi:MAG TPA: hypothetical protein VHO24_03325 [Opitutaceae bacterium]|nr:hypothetical protein [Opitutaceae bacterium]